MNQYAGRLMMMRLSNSTQERNLEMRLVGCRGHEKFPQVLKEGGLQIGAEYPELSGGVFCHMMEK